MARTLNLRKPICRAMGHLVLLSTVSLWPAGGGGPNSAVTQMHYARGEGKRKGGGGGGLFPKKGRYIIYGQGGGRALPFSQTLRHTFPRTGFKNFFSIISWDLSFRQSPPVWSNTLIRFHVTPWWPFRRGAAECMGKNRSERKLLLFQRPQYK